MEDYRTLWNHLEQLVRKRKVTAVFVLAQRTRRPIKVRGLRERFFKALVRHNDVIFAAPGRTGSHPSRVMSVARLSADESNFELKRAKVEIRSALSFLDENKMGTIQPHDDALVVIFRIGGYNVNKVMVDQGSDVEIMYPDLYRWLNLKLEDLTTYDSTLVSFDEKVVISRG